jgi:hypothetical protein
MLDLLIETARIVNGLARYFQLSRPAGSPQLGRTWKSGFSKFSPSVAEHSSQHICVVE